MPPHADSMLAHLPLSLLDLETTGLDVAHDRIVEIGALHMTGSQSKATVALGGTLILFLAVAALASFIPAARASATDPIGVLRSE